MSSKASLALALVLLHVAALVLGASPVVNTKNGAVQGREAKTQNLQLDYQVFQGIPYAEPPLGDLRFKPPVPKENWSGTLDATKDGNICIQNKDPVDGSEDCLFINVFTPSTSGNLPVMVWIYGGGFEGGSSLEENFGPDPLMEKGGVVIVTFNYRLGILGFASTGDLVSPGNNGLKDQVLALKWVRDNIGAFGGDSSHVTIFGQSAGGASVAYHIQSPLSAGLFHAAIIQSGTSLSGWSYSLHNTELVTKVATDLKLDTTSSETIIESLRGLSAADLQTKALSVETSSFLNHDPREGFAFGPVSEPAHEGAFFVGKSHEILSSGNFNKVPTIVGHNSLEGAMEFPSAFRLIFFKFDSRPALFTPVNMNAEATDTEAIGKLIKLRYFGTGLVSTAKLPLNQFISDDQWGRPTREFVRQLSAHNPEVYFYRFSFQGNLWGVNRTLPGVGHSEELGYLWKSKFEGNDQDYLVADRMTTLWTNFGRTKNPTPSKDPLLQNNIWKPSSSPDFDFIEIDTDIAMGQRPQDSEMTFWDDLYATYGKAPHWTY